MSKAGLNTVKKTHSLKPDCANGKPVDHAFLSNGYGSALVERDLTISWLELPRFDSPPIFCSIIDELSDSSFRVKFREGAAFNRTYDDGSLTLRTRVVTKNGEAVFVDLMPQAEPAFMRIVKSNVEFDIILRPTFNYGLIKPSFYEQNSGGTFIDPTNGQAFELKIKWSSGVKAIEWGRWRLEPGQGYMLMLYTSDIRHGLFSRKSGVYSIPTEALPSTREFWSSTISGVKITPPRWAKRHFVTSVMVSIGLMYRPSGAFVAAPTTSLPEVVGDTRNWDYRYAWIRDTSVAAEALISIGLVTVGRNALNFLLSVLDPSRKPFNHTLYSVDGGPPPAERELGWLSGYMCSRPVRIGNAAHMQIQLDLEGEFLGALKAYYAATKDKEYILRSWWAVAAIARFAYQNYTRPDAGIWEERGRAAHYTHSKVMMWSALNTAAWLAKEVNRPLDADRWSARASEIKGYILKNAWSDKSQSFTRSFGSEDVDASLLVMPLYGFIDPNDEMFKLTLKRIEDELVVDHLVFRYKKDFLGSAKYPFGLASSWVARVKLMMGLKDEAELYIKKLISCSNDLGLLGEHIDPYTCEPHGNYPQLYTHVGLLQAVAELSSAWPPKDQL